MKKKKSIFRTLLAVLLAAVLALPVRASSLPTIYGIVTNSNIWTGTSAQPGVYSFVPTGTTIQTVPEKLDPWLISNSGGVWYDGKLYYMHNLQSGGNMLNMFMRWNTDTWEQEIDYTMASSESDRLASDLTYDPVTKQVYGFFFTTDGSAYELGTMEFTDASPIKHTIRRTPIDMVAIAASAEGRIFGIGVNGFFYEFDKETGVATVVGNTNVAVTAYRQSATFDFRTNKLYWAAVLDDGTRGALYEVNTATGNATLIGDFAHSEEITGLYIPFGQASDGAPMSAESVQADFQQGGLTGQLHFTIPTETYGGGTLAGTVSYDISVDDNPAKSGQAEAGAAVSEELTLEEGLHTFTVVLSNAAGTGPKARTQAYVGHDTPVAPENLTLSLDIANYQTHLKWDFTSHGVNNGFVDPDEVTYTVLRYPGPVVIEEDYDGNAIRDDLPQLAGINSYYYTVQGFYQGKASALSTTATFNVGDAVDVPWSEDFSVKSNFSQFTIIDANNDGSTWEWAQQKAQCENSSLKTDKDQDDWLVTPPLKMQADRLYQLEFEASSYWLWDRGREEYFEVGFGDNPLAQDYDIVIENHMMQQTQEGIPLKYSVKLRPQQDGTYYVGFHALTPLRELSRLCIDNIVVNESSLLTSPDSVTNLRLEPAARGALRATIKFNAPTRDLAGDEIQGLSQILVYREGTQDELIATITDPAPGEELSYQDTKCVNGYNSYRVVPMSGDNQGQPSRVTGYVGIDYPTAPRNIQAVLIEDGIKITWDAPSEVGVNGGYVDTDDLIYVVADKNGNTLPGASELYDQEFVDHNVALTGAQATNQYYVLPYSELGAHSSGIGVSNVVITGDPYELPLYESFAGGAAHYLWALTADQDYYGFTITRQESSDGDNGSVYFMGSSYMESVTAYLGSGKISMAGTNSPRWSFSYKPYVGHGVVVNCQVETPDFQIHDVLTIDYRTLTGSNDWRKAVVDLSPYKDEPWVRVIVKCTIIGGTYQFTIDDIAVEDVPADNLLASLYVPKTMRIGMPKDVKVIVKNVGTRTAADYTVRLTSDGQPVGEQPGVSVEPLDSVVFEFPFAAPVTASPSIVFQGVVDYAADAAPSDNSTEALAADILQPTLPGVRNVALTQDADDDSFLLLSWEAPNIEDHRQVTEDFEDYSSWLTQGFGQWQVIDQDNARTYDMSGSVYPHQSMPTAFMIFNNSETSGTRYDNMNAHSGEQVAASFDAIPSYTTLRRTADWLISPELSGEAQTIRFFARSVAELYLDKMEVAYTTGAPTTRSGYTTLQTFDPVPNAWTEYNIDLPEGAKYFAIRNTSSDKMALIVDDITYEPLPLVLTGYDIYRSGSLEASVPADVTSASLPYRIPGGNDFQVVAVYTVGESSLSDVVGSGYSGIDEVFYSLDLTQAEVTVYTLDGVQVAKGRGAYQTLRPGVYVVRPADSQRSIRVVKR